MEKANKHQNNRRKSKNKDSIKYFGEKFNFTNGALN